MTSDREVEGKSERRSSFHLIKDSAWQKIFDRSVVNELARGLCDWSRQTWEYENGR